MSKSLEDRVVEEAVKVARAKSKVGKNGLCWELVHRVLTTVRAKSYQDYPRNAKDAALSAWGKPDNDFIPGYIMVFENATVTQKQSDRNGSTTTRTGLGTKNGHVAIVVQVLPGNVVTIVHQNAPLHSGPHGFQFTMTELSGTWKTFAPEPAGKN